MHRMLEIKTAEEVNIFHSHDGLVVMFRDDFHALTRAIGTNIDVQDPELRFKRIQQLSRAILCGMSHEQCYQLATEILDTLQKFELEMLQQDLSGCTEE